MPYAPTLHPGGVKWFSALALARGAFLSNQTRQEDDFLVGYTIMLSPMDQPEKVIDAKGQLDYDRVVQYYPWILERGHNCIISPDSDGFLCGLFMSRYLGWKVKGFYDGKALFLEDGFSPQDCIFLDMEIFRKEVRSVGQHMIGYRHSEPPPNWDNFQQCISANNLRGFYYDPKFPEKYPLGTIHLLMAILGARIDISPIQEGISYLLYTDGTFKNLLGYPENSLSWLHFLGIDQPSNAANSIFFSQENVLSNIMLNLQDIFSRFAAMNAGRRGADKIQLTKVKEGKQMIVGAEKDEESGTWKITQAEQEKNKKFLQLLASVTGWEYKPASWQYDQLQLREFKKGNMPPTKGRFMELMKQNPISFAITGAKSGIEYTLEGPDKLL